MSDYPDYAQTLESQQSVSTGFEDYRASNGTFLAVDHGHDTYLAFSLVHIGLTDAQFQALVALYDSKQSATGTQSFTFTSQHDQREYTVKFTARPSREKIAPDSYRVTVQLVSVVGESTVSGSISPT